MKIKELDIGLLVNRQIRRSALHNVDNAAHVKRCERVMNKLRNRKANRVSLTDAYHVIDKLFEDHEFEEIGSHKYSLSLLFDQLRGFESKPCLGIAVTCPYCGGKGHLAPRSKVSRKAKPEQMVYVCDNFDEGCETYVSAHRGDNLPMGTMATKETRSLRVDVHCLIDKLWKSGLEGRRQVYNRLGKFLNVNNFHVANLDSEQCKMVLNHSEFFSFE